MVNIERRQRLIEVMGILADDCATDAAALDRTPFDKRGVGESLGSMLAQIQACAEGIKFLAEEQTIAASIPKCPVCFLPMSLYARHYAIRGNYACTNIHCTHREEVKA